MEESRSSKSLPSEFLIEKYKLDRSHELELNKFTHALEMERLKLLTFLNGGVAAAWLTFTKPDKSGSNANTFSLIVGPSFIWLLGLFFASLAMHFALLTQRKFMISYHRRRRADEWRTLSMQVGRHAVRQLLPTPYSQKEDETEEEAYFREANEAQKYGMAASESVYYWTFLSILAFVVGALLAGGVTVRSW